MQADEHPGAGRAGGLTRRDFFRQTAGALSASFALSGGACARQGPIAEHTPVAQAPPRPPAEAKATKVVLIRDAAATDDRGGADEDVVGAMLDEAMLALTGQEELIEAWRQFLREDDFLGIKANVMMTPTHFPVVRRIVESAREVGVAEDRVLAWDRGQGGSSLAQIQNLLERPRWEVPEEEKPFQVPFDDRDISTAVTQKATVLVNVPGLKTHWLSGMGCAIKNWAGAVTNINVADRNTKFAFHSDSCAQTGMLNAIPEIRQKEKLIVVDALRPLFHGGPQVDPKYLWNYRGLLVGTDPVAVDAVCLQILQAKRNQHKGKPWPVQPPAKHVLVAESEYGLGTADLDKVEVVKLGWEQGRLL